MAAKVPAKSILKKPSMQPKISDKDRHNLNLALQHAYLIQHQKDVDAQILASIETLLEIPASSAFTPEEVRTFTTLVQLYQPSDLDALIEERRIDGHCGYALCRNAPRSATLGESASWKLGKGAASFCSAKCTRKMLYVKTQLSEVPAWERDPTVPVHVRLHEDDRPAEERALPNMKQYRVANRNDGDDLALERGEKSASLRPKQVIADKIVENRNVVHKPMSSLNSAAISSTAIEGYEPKRSALSAKHEDSSDDSEDEDDGGGAEQLLNGTHERGYGAQDSQHEGAVTQVWVGSRDEEAD